MFKRVLFCIPLFPNKYGLPAHPHTGIGYICENLSRYGIETEVADLRLGGGIKELKRKVKEFKPDLIGVTMMTYHHSHAYDLVAFLKSYQVPIAVGGPHVSTLKEQVLDECGADFGFKMEAEASFADFCLGKPYESIPGLIYRKGGRFIQNEPQFILNLNSFPFPRYKNFDLDAYSARRIGIITSRGCPCSCTFCPISTVMGRKYRFRSAEHVFEELSYWYAQGIREFDFQDDNFIIDKARLYRIFDMIKASGFKGLKMQCGNGIRADLTTKELLERMKEVGFDAIAFGIESATPEVLTRVKKGETYEELENAVRLATEVGMNVNLFFIVGLPGETATSFNNSLKFALKYPVSIATFYNLIPFPGTALFEWVKMNGYFIKQPKEYLNSIAHMEFVPVFETPDFSAKDRRKALLKAEKLTRLLKRRDMQQKLGNTVLARFGAWLIYGTYLNKIIFLSLKVKIIKQSISWVLSRLNLRVNL